MATRKLKDKVGSLDALCFSMWLMLYKSLLIGIRIALLNMFIEKQIGQVFRLAGRIHDPQHLDLHIFNSRRS